VRATEALRLTRWQVWKIPLDKIISETEGHIAGSSKETMEYEVGSSESMAALPGSKDSGDSFRRFSVFQVMG